MNAKSKQLPEEYLGNNLLAICSLVETKISHEFNLINHRVTWLATSQSFLVLALITLLAARDNHPAIRIFLISIPIIGLFLCVQVFLAVGAALRVLSKHLLPERGLLTRELNKLAGTSFAPLGEDRLTDFFGTIPSIWIPVTFIVTWLVFLALVIGMTLSIR